MVKRAVTTLVARGGGSYVTKDPLAHPIIPDYVATVLPLLCSFARLTATSVPQLQFVALTHNLTTDELAHLRSNRAITMEVAAIAPAIVGLPMRAARQDCLLRSNFSWAAHGRSDIASTMLKHLCLKTFYIQIGYTGSHRSGQKQIAWNRPSTQLHVQCLNFVQTHLVRIWTFQNKTYCMLVSNTMLILCT